MNMKLGNFLKLSIAVLFLSKIATAQIDESWKVYDDSQVGIVEITMAPSALQYMYDHPNSDSMHVVSVHFENAFINETLDSVAIRIRGNTSRESNKKSFKLSFNELIKGRQFYDLDNLNLNGEHNDPSIIRSKLVWDIYKDIGMISSRAAHAAVYINGKYYGLYISVEHIDDKFLRKNFEDDEGNLWKCLYPADLVYKGSNPDLYKQSDGGRRTYDLTTNEIADDYSALARLISIINTTPSDVFPDSLESVLAVYEVLKYFAVDVLTGCWDDYWFLKNNYYLYHEPSKDVFHWIPYDTDNSFGIDWFNIDWANVNPYTFAKMDNGPRPLVQKIMVNSEYRNLYTHFIEFYTNNVYDLSILEPRINRLQSMIIEEVVADSFRTLDYGFTLSDFYNSYSESGFSKNHVKRGIKEFINVRKNSLQSQLTWKDSKHIIYKLDWRPRSPSVQDTIYITASAFSHSGLKTLTANFAAENSQTILYPMEFLPVTNTKMVEEADRWICKIPPTGKPGMISIFAEDINSVIEQYPRRNPIRVKENSPIIINEILAKNESTNTDQDGEAEDWIELYNSSTAEIKLSGKFLTDSRNNLNKWRFPGEDLVIKPGEFILIWCDEDTLQAGLHANFKLDVDGEFTALIDNDGITILDSIKFPVQSTDISYGRFPDGTLSWQFLQPTPGTGNITDVKENNIPEGYELSVYPNPFNPSVTIDYILPEKSKVRIAIYDLLGKEILKLNEGIKEPGKYSVQWKGNSSNGYSSSGIYLCRITTEKWSKTIKLIQMK